MGEILVTCYDNGHGYDFSRNGTRSPNDVFNSSIMNKLETGAYQDVLRLHGMLKDWYDSLPRYLRADRDYPSPETVRNDPSPDKNSELQASSTLVFARQADILRAR